jgi:hypothetical protein
MVPLFVCVLSEVLMMLSGMSETTLTMTFAQAAGCPREALMRYTRP